MRPGDRDLGDFLAQEVLPFLSVQAVYGDVKWASRRDGARYWRGRCPLHGGDNPTAFSVDTKTKRWTCYSHCGSGSAVDFLNGGKRAVGRDFVEKVRELAALAGVPFPELERTAEEVKRAEERERRSTLLETFLAVVQETLQGAGGEPVRSYLKGRGLEEAAEGLGLYRTRESVLEDLVSKGFTKEEVEASGVVRDGRWGGRLVIPWRDRWGRLVTFAARDLTGTVEDAEKYLYMTGTKKAELVAFGLDVALRRPPEELVLVEGLLDVVHLQSLGFLNVAAIGGAGKEMSPERWAALAGLGVKSVVLMLDRDKAGREGTLAAVDNVRKVRNVRNVPVVYVSDPDHLNPYKDPDELVHHEGLDALRAILEGVEPAALYVGRSTLGDVKPTSPDRERIAAAEWVVDYAETLEGDHAPLVREDLLRLVRERTGYSEDALLAVQEKLRERHLLEERERLVDEALKEAAVGQDRGLDPMAVVRKLSEKLAAVAVKAEDAPPAFSVDRLEQESKTTPAGKPSGWAALDRLEVFFNPGELAVIAARTGHCKTSILVGLFLAWAMKAAEDQGDELVVLYSQEEPEVRIYHRLLALLSYTLGTGWSVGQVRDYLRDPYSCKDPRGWPLVDSLNKARELLKAMEGHLLVVSRPSWTVEELESHANGLAGRRKVGAVLVDYLQRVPPPPPRPGSRYDRRDIEVSAVARRLKALAVDLGVPVVTGAQVNRDPAPDKARREKIGKASYLDARKVIREARPDLANLREGGSEQEADLILGLLNYAADYRTDEDGEETKKVPDVTLLEVGALKNRYGVPGRWAGLAYEGRFNAIRDPFPGEEV